MAVLALKLMNGRKVSFGVTLKETCETDDVFDRLIRTSARELG